MATAFKDLDFDLTIDDTQLNMRSSGQPVLDESVKLLATKTNRFLLSQAVVRGYKAEGADRSVTEIIFQLDAILAQKCRLDQLILSVSFGQDNMCRVEDMQPDTVTGDEPVKQTVEYKGGLKFEWGKLKLGPSFETSKSEEKNVYYPEITAHGVPFNFASWHFRGNKANILDIKKEFRILLTRNNEPQTLPVAYRIEADIRYDGWLGSIPIIGNKSVEFILDEII